MKINITLKDYKKLVNSKKEKEFFKESMKQKGFVLKSSDEK